MKDEQIRQLNFADWPLPDNYLVELGRLHAMWGALEGQLDVYLGKLAGFDQISDPRPFILIKDSSIPQNLDSLAALCEHLAPQHPNLTAYESALRLLRSASKLRGKYAHNGMSLNPDTGRVEMAVGSARGKVQQSVETVSLADLRRASMEVHLAMLALHALVTGVDLPPKWERTEKS